jgi:hypothetical protein
LDSRLRKRRAVAKTTNFPPTGATGGHRT